MASCKHKMWSPMDSPLNQAHQQSRQADLLVRARKFEEAIVCHQRAAEHILEAMQQATSDHALESLRLQHQNHCRQQEIIRSKERELQLAEVKQSNRTSDSESREAQNTKEQDGKLEEETVHQTTEETDSLLQFLLNRKHGNGYKSLEALAVAKMPVAATFGSGSKFPKDDKMIIEELHIHNEELRKHILQLLKEIDNYKEENQTLKMKVELLEEKKMSHLGLHADDMLSPLELPKVDFESFPVGRHMYGSSTSLEPW